MRGPLHLRGLQAAHTAAGRLGALLPAAAGRPPAGLCVPGASRRSGAALRGLVLAVLRGQDTRLAGEPRAKCGDVIAHSICAFDKQIFPKAAGEVS